MRAPDLSSVTSLAQDVRKGRITPEALVDACITRISGLNPRLNAFLSLNPRARAEALTLRADRRAPLYGVPIAIKDLILGADAPATAGSRIFGEGLTSDHDAPVLRRLRRAGAVIVGRTNLHELALGVTNLNEHFGPARNPWDTTRVPGGSSGGSAVAVAARMVPAAIGSDTRGSIRIPAALCGITGLKPTYGLVPTDDVIPLSWSLDHVGPITTSVIDAAVLLGAMTTPAATRAYTAATRRSIRRLRVGVCEYFLRDLAPDVERAVRAAVDVLAAEGARVEEIALPQIDPSHGVSATITLAEAVTYHERALRERPEGFGPAVRGRLERGFNLTAVELVQAQRARVEITAAFDRVFRDVDCVVGATVPAVAQPIGRDELQLRGRTTTLLAEYPRLTSPANLAGIPALSVPCGFDANGLPIGFQIMAARRRDAVVLAVGAAYQRKTKWHLAVPKL